MFEIQAVVYEMKAGEITIIKYKDNLFYIQDHKGQKKLFKSALELINENRIAEESERTDDTEPDEEEKNLFLQLEKNREKLKKLREDFLIHKKTRGDTKKKTSKVCYHCKKNKKFSEFYTCTSRNDGLQTYCKICQNSYNKKRKEIINHSIRTMDFSDTKFCNRCKTPKPTGEFHIKRNTPDGLQDYCKTCMLILINQSRIKRKEREQKYKAEKARRDKLPKKRNHTNGDAKRFMSAEDITAMLSTSRKPFNLPKDWSVKK